MTLPRILSFIDSTTLNSNISTRTNIITNTTPSNTTSMAYLPFFNLLINNDVRLTYSKALIKSNDFPYVPGSFYISIRISIRIIANNHAIEP
jgi:hypothetical protein